jgi:hypothetical protein
MPTSTFHDVYGTSNIVHQDPRITGPYPKDVVWVYFQNHSSEGERQAAFDSVGGVVIATQPIGPGGIYYVRLPTGANADSLHQAIGKLETLPQVHLASPDLSLAFRPTYRTPQDGLAWRRADWKLHPDSAGGANWGLEFVNAPEAWGCELGKSSVSVGVVDVGFHNVADLTPNVAYNPAAGQSAGMHGTGVASIIGARGDDSIGMTGMMWHVGLRLYDYAARTPNPGEATVHNPYRGIQDAARDGSRVVNLSSGVGWLNVQPGSAADSAKVRNVASFFYQMLVETDSLGFRPLIVIAAGNDNLDAWWSGVTQVADSTRFRDRVIVVAASDSMGGIAAFSNRNVHRSIVSVAAPGDEVGMLDGSASVNVIRDSGTSFAAPYVSGLAGLLASFDPRLSATDLKRLIVAGADSSKRKAGGISIIDAYWTLRLAAASPGAPLCGNRVWIQNGQVKAQRGTAGTGTVETLFSVPFEHSDLQVYHGGRIRVLDSGTWDDHFFIRDSTGWHEDTGQLPPATFDSLMAEYGPSYRSYFGEDHNGENWVYVDPTTTAIQVYRRNLTTWMDTPVAIIPWTSWHDSLQYTCVRRWTGAQNCTDSIKIGRTTNRSVSSVAVSPLNGAIFVAVAKQQTEVATASDWADCPGIRAPHEWAMECRSYSDHGTSNGGSLYTIPAAGGTYTPLPVGSIANMYEVTISDGRPEFSTKVEYHQYRRTFKWYPDSHNRGGFWSVVDVDTATVTSTSSCHVQFRNTVTGAMNHSVQICGYNNHTFSPSLVPTTSGLPGGPRFRPSPGGPPLSPRKGRRVSAEGGRRGRRS